MAMIWVYDVTTTFRKFEGASPDMSLMVNSTTATAKVAIFGGRHVGVSRVVEWGSGLEFIVQRPRRSRNGGHEVGRSRECGTCGVERSLLLWCHLAGKLECTGAGLGLRGRTHGR